MVWRRASAIVNPDSDSEMIKGRAIALEVLHLVRLSIAAFHKYWGLSGNGYDFPPILMNVDREGRLNQPSVPAEVEQ